MDDFPQAALGDSGDVLVNGNDPFEVNGCWVVIPQDLEFRVVDDEPPVQVLHFSIETHLLPRGDDLLNERHVEPPAGDFPRAENAAGTVHHDRFIIAPTRTGMPESSVDHHAAKTHGGRRRLIGKRIEVPPVFIALGEMREHLRGSVEAGRGEGHHLSLGKKRQRSQVISSGKHCGRILRRRQLGELLQI